MEKLNTAPAPTRVRGTFAFVLAGAILLWTVQCGSEDNQGPQFLPLDDKGITADGSTEGGTGPGTQIPDGPRPDDGKADQGGGADATTGTMPDTTGTSPVGGPGTPDPDPFVPEEGGFGWPCNDNDDCIDPYCIASRFGRICTTSCIDSCPAGFSCVEVSQDGEDVNFLCVDRNESLCMPCKDHQDCQALRGGTGALCIEFGAEGSFCGAACADDDCPDLFTCVDYPGPNGANSPQCIPNDGRCGCTARATELGATTNCWNRNSVGTCTGTRKCNQDGLTDCDAPEASPERCDGIDNDCDGGIDNLDAAGITCPLENDFGICPGIPLCDGGEVICVGDPPEREICDGHDNDCNGVTDDPYPDSDSDGISDCIDDDDDNDGVIDLLDNCPLDPNPQQENNDGDSMGDACDPDDDNDGSMDPDDCEPLNKNNYPGNIEICDGKDNNCNGTADEDDCDDGNSCTIGSCKADGSCEMQQLHAVPCDDGSVCTQVDMCNNGVCEGMHELDCDDGIQCTDDVCNPLTGCFSKNSAADCDDGNPCTVNDRCVGGECKSGTTKVCDDGNPCTYDECKVDYGGCRFDPRPFDYAPCHRGGGLSCPHGECQAGVCAAKAGVTCSVEIDYDLCKSVTVEGKCSGDGHCAPGQYVSNGCGSCAGICLQCFISICVPLSIFF